MKHIYNEGRVIGLGQYELYVRQVLSMDPNAKVMSERQWLSAALAPNFSMILKIPAGTRRGVHNYILPQGSLLCACTTIYASIFEGGAETDITGWAVGVDDYGRLISNTSQLCPQDPGQPENVPTQANPTEMSENFKEQCRNYLKINAGIVLQPGHWGPNVGYTELLTEAGGEIVTEDTEEIILVPVPIGDAAVGLAPDLKERGYLRFAISEDITEDFLILLNGFSYKPFVLGSIGYKEIQAFVSPQDGDFLGPTLFPWATKIVLVTTNEVANVMLTDINARLSALEGGN